MFTPYTIDALIIVSGITIVWLTWRQLSKLRIDQQRIRQALQDTNDRLELTHQSTTRLTSNVAELRFPDFEPYAFMMSAFPFPEDNHPRYLPLLNLTANARQRVESIYNVQKGHDRDVINRAIVGLLSRQWRHRQRLSWEPHLVAAVALITNRSNAPYPPEILDLVWTRVRDSWVSPQLLASASIVDPDFDDKAQACIVDKVAPKTLSALLALIGKRELANRLAQDPWVAEAVARDRDNGAEIAKSWKSQVLQIVDTTDSIWSNSIYPRTRGT